MPSLSRSRLSYVGIVGEAGSPARVADCTARSHALPVRAWQELAPCAYGQPGGKLRSPAGRRLLARGRGRIAPLPPIRGQDAEVGFRYVAVAVEIPAAPGGRAVVGPPVRGEDAEVGLGDAAIAVRVARDGRLKGAERELVDDDLQGIAGRGRQTVTQVEVEPEAAPPPGSERTDHRPGHRGTPSPHPGRRLMADSRASHPRRSRSARAASGSAGDPPAT